jgi:Skp family chaperone for outer membrane proteins
MNFLRILFVLFLFLSNANSNENFSIRYIDFDFLFKNSSIGKKINDDVNNQKKKLLEKSKKEQLKLKDKKDDILSKKNILDQKEFEELVIEHQKNVEKYQIETNKLLNNVNKEFLNKTIDFKKKVNKIILKYASENKIDIILKKEATFVSNSQLDITKIILDKLN